MRRNGRPVGYIRAASYGHALGGAVGLAGKFYLATLSLWPLYDPQMKRIKC